MGALSLMAPRRLMATVALDQSLKVALTVPETEPNPPSEGSVWTIRIPVGFRMYLSFCCELPRSTMAVLGSKSRAMALMAPASTSNCPFTFSPDCCALGVFRGIRSWVMSSARTT